MIKIYLILYLLCSFKSKPIAPPPSPLKSLALLSQRQGGQGLRLHVTYIQLGLIQMKLLFKLLAFKLRIEVDVTLP